MPKRILVIGAGSIGAFFASRLATNPNVEVSALCRSSYDVVKANGFKILSQHFGDSTFVPEHIFADVKDIRKVDIAWNFIVVATKALPDVSDDSDLLEGLVSKDTSIVLIQNGLGIEEPYCKRFPEATILTCTTMVSCAQISPGVIKHNRWTRTAIGPYRIKEKSDFKDDERIRTFVQLLKQGGINDIDVYNHSDMQFVRWHKVAVNAAMNPTAVLTDGSGNQEIGTDEHLSSHAKGVMEEVLYAAGKVLGKPVPMHELSLASPEQVLKSVRKNSSGSRPSMWHDWEAGRAMELEVILGNPVRLAKDVGVQMPRCQSLYAILRKRQERRDKSRTESKL